MDDITLMTVKEMKMISKKIAALNNKKLFNNLLEKQPFDQMIWTSLTIKLKPTRLKAFFLDQETAKRSSEKLD